MKHIFIGGNGSIGQRHIANLRALQPNAEIVIVDPQGEADYDHTHHLRSFKDSVVYICTPTITHKRKLIEALNKSAAAIFMEKPLISLQHSTTDLLRRCDVPFACGYSYRFHPLFSSLKKNPSNIFFFHLYGTENITDRYGPTALETMLSHSIDLALWLFGPAHRRDRLVSKDGMVAIVQLPHRNNVLSFLHADMLSPYRVATCTVGYTKDKEEYFDLVNVVPTNEMYLDEMQAWLHFLDTGERGNLCSYEEALQVQELMEEARDS